ncbi:MAG: hypothetical protein K940chlam3_00343 [Chlamydiae bacterium]|nr:hypothetical protein [Chlamydiota bacterium]
MIFDQKMTTIRERGTIPEKFLLYMQRCYDNFRKVTFTNDDEWQVSEQLFRDYLDLVEKQFIEPFVFEPYHEKVKKPFDYEEFSVAFIRPLIIFEKSKLFGENHLHEIDAALESKENVILLANHQTEPDPQILNLMLREKHPRLAKEMIFIAGDRVVTDPMAVPSSLGCNLICIYSKKHMENPPELKEEKLKHNQRTMREMSQLLSEGGKCIYVAPSGGRDRPGDNGTVEVAPFHPQSIEMLWLMSQKADRPTHFHPLALGTYDILPPPDVVDVELGEDRLAQKAPVYISFGSEIDMEVFPGSEESDRKVRRQNRADYIWNLVKGLYREFPQ